MSLELALGLLGLRRVVSTLRFRAAGALPIFRCFRFSLRTGGTLPGCAEVDQLAHSIPQFRRSAAARGAVFCFEPL
jgi:hypothetical protein